MTTTTKDNLSADYAANPLNRMLARGYTLNWEAAVYIVILILAIFTRFYGLGDRTMSHDESLHVKFSYDLYSQGVFVHTPLMHGPIIFHATALMYFLFGDNDFTARLYPAILSVLLVMFPLLFRRWLGRWGAILASIMFLISPLMMYYGRYIREDTPSIFFTVIMVYCTFQYLNGPVEVRRKARWLYIFAGAMLASMASKEVAFIYIAIFGSFLTLYWLVRMGQYFYQLPGKLLMYFLSIAGLIGGIAALAMYVVLTITPLQSSLTAGPGSLEYASLMKWTIAIAAAVIAIVVGTLLWAFGGRMRRFAWVDGLLMLALIVIACAFFLYVEERSKFATEDSSKTSAPVVPGQDTAATAGVQYRPGLLYIEWIVGAGLIGILLMSRPAGWWRKLHRFPELDILIVMGSLALPWLTPFIMKAMGATPTEMGSIATAVQAAIPIKLDTSQYGVQIFLSSLPVIPALAVGTVAGLMWNWKRWLISAAVFYILFLFFFTTVFTNIAGVGSGMIGSLGYWLEQQAVRRGNQPQYYYLVLILPFYEFLPIIGSIAAMFSGLVFFWRYCKNRVAEVSVDDVVGLNSGEEETDSPAVASFELIPKPAPDPLKQVPFLLFVSWWVVLNLIAYTLAGEKMPWLGTHMTTPMIFLAGWYFGRIFDNLDFESFWKRNWLYLLLIPVMFVALAQVAAPLLFGPAPEGLSQQQLTRTYQWIGGILIAGIVGYGIFRLSAASGWSQFRRYLGVSAFVFLGFLTFRSAWMAAFINYDLPTEYLVYAHGAPANKRVTEQLEDLSKRTTDGMDLKFAYDFKISWPGAWYFRHFKNATFLGNTPSPRSMEDALVVIVGDENRSAAESALEDRYYRFDYMRLWWPMQEYFNLTPQRVVDTFDLSGANPKAAQVRQGIFDIWWSRDYKTYGDAVGKNFDITQWPVADKMYVFVRKDLAAKVWSLGVGDGKVTNAPVDVNVCNQNWQPLAANLAFASVPAGQLPLSFPRQIAINAAGQIYAAEEFNNRVSVFNADGSFNALYGQKGPDVSGAFFERPNGVAIGPSGNIYVADTWNYRVKVLSPRGETIATWGQKGELGAGAPVDPKDAFWGPRAIAVDSQERVYVADTGNKRVRVYTKDGQYIRDIGAGGANIGQLDEPSGLAISPNGVLYVADTWNRRISAFTLDGQPALLFAQPDGSFTNWFKVRGWYDDLGNRPYLALDSQRNLLYVTDPDAGRVLVYNTDGSCAGSFGQLNRDKQDQTQFASVGGIVTDTQGNIYVADAGSGRILRFAPYQWPVAAKVPSSGQVIQPPAQVPVEKTLDVLPNNETTPEATQIPAG
jgi:uncharacterized protein (TIGR03663 family)